MAPHVGPAPTGPGPALDRPLRVLFVCPSGRDPIGGVTVLYEFANGLARRGHDVHLVHVPMWGRRIERLEDLDRFRLEPTLTHHLPGTDPDDLGDIDLVFGTGADARLGLPVLLVQGIEMLHTHLERQAFRTPGLKVCVASWLVEVGRRYGVPPEQFEVVPMGIDHETYRLTAPIEDRPLQVAMLYSTHTAKAWDVGLAALEEVQRRVPEVRARVFGTTAPPDVLPPWVEFTRAPSIPTLVDDIYNRSRVFIQASDYEGFGLTAIEAMACGAALVTTDNGGSDDYAVHGETALVAPPRDAAGLGAHAAALLRDDGARRRLAHAGRLAVQRFDWDRSSEVLEGHLLRYLADPDAFLHAPGPELDAPGAVGPVASSPGPDPSR